MCPYATDVQQSAITSEGAGCLLRKEDDGETTGMGSFEKWVV